MTTGTYRYSPLFGMTEEEIDKYLKLKAITDCDSFDDCPTCKVYAAELRQEYAREDANERGELLQEDIRG